VVPQVNQAVGLGDGVSFAIPSGQPVEIGNVWPVVQAEIAGAGPTLPVHRGIDLSQFGWYDRRWLRRCCWRRLAATGEQQQGE